MAEPDFQPLTLQNYYELRDAIFSGAQTVSYSHPGGSKSVSYRSLDEMMRLLRLLASMLGVGNSRGARSYASFSKGYIPPSCDNHTEGGECFNVDGRCCP